MTEERLYLLAHDALLTRWGREKDFLQECPGSEIRKNREKKLWTEMMELEDVMKEKGYGYSK